ncbi:MAG: hypothetical protein IT210_10655 [Armatimonadetes bacterium]|nr:hypothetical protein [Armatimonadota bacterium]
MKNGGRRIVWLYAPGYFPDSGPGSASHISEVSGIRVSPRPKPPGPASAEFVRLSEETAIPPLPLLNGDQFVIEDAAACVLVRRSEPPHEAAVAVKSFPDWHSVYAASAPLSRHLLRHLAKKAGVHLYHDSPQNAGYANGSYLTLAVSPAAGKRTLRLPRKATVTDLTTGQVIAQGAESFTVDFLASEVRIFNLK